MCKRCHKPGQFYKNNKSTCKDCLREICRQRDHTKFPSSNPAIKRNKTLQRRYGITSDIYEEMLRSQEGRCWICHRLPGKKRLAVDHSHKTGKVRGLLCSPCNHRLLPAARENPAILRRAAEYLEKEIVN